MDFPLKADFFPQVRLMADERAKYARLVETSCAALRRAVDARDWVKLYDKDGVAFAKMHRIDDQQSRRAAAASATGAATACIAVCATIFTPGTISEVLEAIASPVTEDYRKAMKFLYKSRFLDAVALHTLPSTASQAFTTLKWAAFDDGKGHNSAKFPLGSDYCFLEHSGIERDDDGDAFGFSLQESVVREREVPSLAGFGLRRGELHATGIIVLPTERRDVVQVSSILQMRLLGSDSAANKAALERLMLKRVAAVGRIDMLLERRRLSKMQFVTRDAWVADEDRKACAVCLKPFSLRRRHHCRNCGEVVCSTCAPPREVDVSSLGSALIRICTACVVHARSEPQQAASSQDVLVYHVRSTLSSRTSSNSSDNAAAAAAAAESSDVFADAAPPSSLGAPPLRTTRPRAFSSDSNFSIASECPQQQQPMGHIGELSGYYYEHQHQLYQHQQHQYQYNNQQHEHEQQHEYEHALYDEDEFDEDMYYARDSQASSESSSYSFSDLNTFDDRFGSIALKCLAPQQQPSVPVRTATAASSIDNNRHVPYHESRQSLAPTPSLSTERSVYNPAKVVTHLLTRETSEPQQQHSPHRQQPQPPPQPHPQAASDARGELSSSFMSSDSLDEDFHSCIRGLQEDISRATTARFSDLEPGESFCSDLASFRSDLLASTHSTTAAPEDQEQLPLTQRPQSPAPPLSQSPPSASTHTPNPSPVSLSPSAAAHQDLTGSTGSSPSAVDADIELLLLNDDFSLLCPDTLQRQQQRQRRRRASSVASSLLQDTSGRWRTPSTASSTQTVSPLRGSSVSRFSVDSALDEETYAGGERDKGHTSGDGDGDDNDDLESHADLLALRRQVEGLHRSLADATNKLQYYQSRSTTAASGGGTDADVTRLQRTASTDSDVSSSAPAAVAPLPPASSSSASTSPTRRLSRRSKRRGSAPSSGSKDKDKDAAGIGAGQGMGISGSARQAGGGGGGGSRVDPAFAKRTETYDALVSELHELMGLPTLSPRVARGY